jgi:hypothetical protein
MFRKPCYVGSNIQKIGGIPMLEQLTGLLAALQGLDPMFVIAFMLCLNLLMKRRS